MNGFIQKLKPWLITVLVVIGFAAYVAFQPPGCEQTDKQPKRPDGPPKPALTSVERLRAAWDSEGPADWPVTELLASISNIAYQTPPAAKTSYGDLGFKRVNPIIIDSMAVYVIGSEDVAVIAFRGTDDPADWLVNLNALTTPTPNGDMHRGFSDAYKTLKPQIMDVLRQEKPKHLWVTGHSLGGALAVVCAYDVIEVEKIALDGVITFGQPMVARQTLATYLDTLLMGRYAHAVNDADIVPRVPPTFSHCGSLVWFTEDGIRRSKPKRRVVGAPPDEPVKAEEEAPKPLTNAEFDQLKASLKQRNEPEKRPDGRPVYQGNTPWLRDHSMSLYIDKVRSFIGHIGELLRPRMR
jgi:pimeloyl-ACP methyl ester carboxylesterase